MGVTGDFLINECVWLETLVLTQNSLSVLSGVHFSYFFKWLSLTKQLGLKKSLLDSNLIHGSHEHGSLLEITFKNIVQERFLSPLAAVRVGTRLDPPWLCCGNRYIVFYYIPICVSESFLKTIGAHDTSSRCSIFSKCTSLVHFNISDRYFYIIMHWKKESEGNTFMEKESTGVLGKKALFETWK